MSSRYCDNIADCFQSCSLHMHNIIVFVALNLRNTDVGMFHFKHGGVSSMPKNTWDMWWKVLWISFKKVPVSFYCLKKDTGGTSLELAIKISVEINSPVILLL